MKKLLVLFTVWILLLTCNFVSAQQKIGHINSDDIFSSWSESKTAQAAVETYAKAKQAEIEKIIEKFQSKLKAAQNKEKTLNEVNKEAVMKELTEAQIELQELAKNIEDIRTKATKDLVDKENELLSPLRKKMNNAISVVAKENGLSYVFDIATSQGFNNISFMDNINDISTQIKSKLGIAVGNINGK